MIRITKIIILLFFTSIIPILALSKPKNALLECWNKQVKPLQLQYLQLSYHENLNELEHSFEPWQQTSYTGKGIIWCNINNFIKQDTLLNGNRTYFSRTLFNERTLVFLDYGDKDLYPVTKSMFLNQTVKTARYSPNLIINYFIQHNIISDKESNTEFIVYRTTIEKTIVTLYIHRSDNLVTKITTLNDDQLFGDVLSTFVYSNYHSIGKAFYPRSIQIEKINGKLKDEVQISIGSIIKETPKILIKPTDYQLKEDAKENTNIEVEKYSDNIHFIKLNHTDDKVMVVEFSDYLLIAEAPVNSNNGELIINQAKKIAPNKHIKYFIFGHYHPHYLGGIRPFIHNNAKILCPRSDIEYVTYLADAPHTLNPDSLQLEPHALQVEEIIDNKTITDGIFEMKIYFIGKKSEHTNDYLIYYFPKEKIVFEDDLVWIPKSGEVKKASGRQAGLYNAIIELGLDVETVIQSWPVSEHGVKTIIPFEDLKKSMALH